MEKALFLPPGEVPSLSGFDRLYIGSEFCPWTFPSLSRIRQGLQLARSAQLPLTLVTPIFGEFFGVQLKSILAGVLGDFLPGDEVVISDWGAYQLIREIAPHQEIVLGRSLSGQKRGPQILDLPLTPEQIEYFQASRFYGAEARQLLAELGISRIELDNPPQGILPVPPPLRASLHTPYAMVTSSRNCPFRHGEGDRGCSVPCGEVFVLRTPQSALPLLQGGNSQFVEITTLPRNFLELRVDRFVIHTVLPR